MCFLSSIMRCRQIFSLKNDFGCLDFLLIPTKKKIVLFHFASRTVCSMLTSVVYHKTLLACPACLLGNQWPKDTSPTSHSTTPGLSDGTFVTPWSLTTTLNKLVSTGSGKSHPISKIFWLWKPTVNLQWNGWQTPITNQVTQSTDYPYAPPLLITIKIK